MKIKSGYMLKKVADNYIVVPVQNLDFDGVITLNETGVVLWEALSTDTETEKLVKLMLDQYEVSEETAKQDVISFLKMLRDENLIDE